MDGATDLLFFNATDTFNIPCIRLCSSQTTFLKRCTPEKSYLRLTILSKYINELDYSVDKKELDNLMRGLYNEALTLETIYD